MSTNAQIAKGAITTDSMDAGLLSPEQSSTFLKQTFEVTKLGPLIRKQMRRSPKGEIDKIGIASRIMRKKVEAVDANSDGSVPIIDPKTGAITGYRANISTSAIEYSCTAVRLPWEISNETIRQNIEGEGYEATVTSLMTTQLGIDLEDIYLNGDEAVAGSDPDHDFLYINDGWIKQIENGGHVYDAAGSAGINPAMFYDAKKSLANKYQNGKLRWLMSPQNQQEWERYLLTQGLEKGGSYPDSMYNSPAGIPIVTCPSMPNDKIILIDPQNLIVVTTYDVKILKTMEGKEAIMRDMRFYTIHLDFDPIIEELDAAAIIKNIGLAA